MMAKEWIHAPSGHQTATLQWKDATEALPGTGQASDTTQQMGLERGGRPSLFGLGGQGANSLSRPVTQRVHSLGICGTGPVRAYPHFTPLQQGTWYYMPLFECFAEAAAAACLSDRPDVPDGSGKSTILNTKSQW